MSNLNPEFEPGQGLKGSMKPYETIHAFILGGGRSLRVNRDKAFLQYHGRYFIDIVIECVSSLFRGVSLVGRRYEHPGLDAHYSDDVEGTGPLGGILTALRRTDRDLNFFVGVDYPFIDREVVAYLAERALEHAPHGDGLIPVMPDGPHPLFAFYARSCLPAVERCISTQSYRVQCIAHHARIRYHEISTAPRDLAIGRFEKNFVNINRYEDYLSLIHES